MSNTGNFIQKMIDQSRGKPRHKSRRTGTSQRRRMQIIFEKTNPLLASMGGSTDDPSTQKHFGRKEQSRTVINAIRNGTLSGDAATAALELVGSKKKKRRLTKHIASSSTGILGALRS